MTSSIETRPFEIEKDRFIEASILRMRLRFAAFDLFACLLVYVVLRFVVRVDPLTSILLSPVPLLIGFFRLPGRVRRLAEGPKSPVPVGRVTFHVDAEGIIYSSSAAEPAVVKWDEILSIRLIKGLYFIDVGFDELVVAPSAFATNGDEEKFRREAQSRVKRTGGF
jgi:hypothetical protein